MKRIIPIFLILINVLSANAQIGYRYKDKFVELIPDSSSTKFILQRDGSVKGKLDKSISKDSQSYSVAISNSISGQTVYKGVLNSEGLEVDTKSWVPGIYVVTSGIDNSTYKILIK